MRINYKKVYLLDSVMNIELEWRIDKSIILNNVLYIILSFHKKNS